jgi:hypothetical protein
MWISDLAAAADLVSGIYFAEMGCPKGGNDA